MNKKEKEVIKEFESLKSPFQIVDFLSTIEQKDLDNILDDSMNKMVKDLENNKDRFES
ncbi:MAG: hypothetical protein HN595_03705 [Flavobacteriaceae bacterium]|jgi:hypothetical protein|nr:hypothetical protein [Flavobacteriaceae bacterium]